MQPSRSIRGRSGRLIAAIGVFLVTAHAIAQQPPAQPTVKAPPPAPCIIAPAVANLGTIRPNSVTEAKFTLTNPSRQTLTVKATTPSCKCTGISNIVGQSIAPGGSIELKAALKAPPNPGDKDAKVFITFNEVPGTAIAMLKGVVEMSISAKPDYLDTMKGATTGTIDVRSADGKPFKILSAGGAAPIYQGFNPASDAPASAYVLKWNLAGVAQPPLWWVVETDRADCPLVPLRIRHELTGSKWDMERFDRQWFAKDMLVLADTLTVGKPTELTIEVEHYNPRNAAVNPEWSKVKSLVTNHPGLNARVLESKVVGDVLEIRAEFTATPEARGLIATQLTLTTASGSGPLPFYAHVAAPVDKK